MSDLKYQTFKLPSALDPIVKYVWEMESNTAEVQQIPDLLIPDGCPEIIFLFDGAYQKQDINNTLQIYTIDSSCIIGIQSNSQLVKRLGKIKLLGLKLKPLGFFQIFKDKISETSNRNIPFKKFNAHWLVQLEKELISCQSISEKLLKISTSISAQITDYNSSPSYRLTRNIIQTIIEKKGNVRVNELSLIHHKSSRQIQRYFKKHIGISPKEFIKIIQFKSFYKENILQQYTANFLDYGYFDQMHFIKVFKAILGTTPSKIAQEHFKLKNEIARISHQ